MSADWIEGRFEGVYSGELVAKSRTRRGRGGRAAKPRRFAMHIDRGRLEAAPCDPLLDRDDDEGRVIRQARIDGVTLVDADGNEGEDAQSLFDVEIRDWHVAYPAESSGRAYGTLFGRLRARTRPNVEPVPEPVESVTEDEGDAPAIEPPRGDEVKPVREPAIVADPLADELSPSETVSRVGWAMLAFLLALVALSIGLYCGPRVALLWLAPVVLAIGLGRVLAGGLRPGAPGWGFFAAAFPPIAIAWLLWDRAVQTGCAFALTPFEVGLLALPLLVTGALGWRGPLWTTGTVWTVAICVACSAGGITGSAACAVSGGTSLTSNEGGAPDAAGLTAPQRPRTDANGRWPVMPDLSFPGGADGAGFGLGSGGGAGVRTAGGSGGVSGDAASGGGQAPLFEGDAVPIVLDGSAAGERDEAPERPSRSPDVTSRQATPGGDGGWVSPEHRRTQRELTLISLEQANRSPTLFYESGGAYRVYVPTDSIFRDSSAKLTKRAQLTLGRVATLLQARDDHRVVIEMHTDSSGSPDSQRTLATERAKVVHAWLVDRGHVPSASFSVAPVGGARPLLPPDGDYAAQQPNRRFEIRLSDDAAR